MGQAVFKRIQLVCFYFGYKASRAGAGWEHSPQLSELLKHVEELVLQNQGFKVFMVQSSDRISKTPSKGPVLIV